MIIKENWLNEEYALWLRNKFLFDTDHKYGHLSTNNILLKPFYYSPFSNSDPLINFVITKLKFDFFKDNKNFNVLRSYINIQHQGMDGDWHTDDGNMTALWMPCESNNNGGEFEIIINNEIQKINYRFNQLIIFNANQKHRGLAFNDFKPRVTLAFKIVL